MVSFDSLTLQLVLLLEKVGFHNVFVDRQKFQRKKNYVQEIIDLKKFFVASSNIRKQISFFFYALSGYLNIKRH
jgi:hypothetical protein